MNPQYPPHYPDRYELQEFRESYIVGHHLGDEEWPVHLCDECGLPDEDWPHRTDEGYDPRVRAFASERALGIPLGTPLCSKPLDKPPIRATL